MWSQWARTDPRNRYQPHIALMKRAHLKAIITTPPAKRMEDLEPAPPKLESHMRWPDGHDEVPMVASLVDSHVQKPREKLEVFNRDTSHKDVLPGIVVYIAGLLNERSGVITFFSPEYPYWGAAAEAHWGLDEERWVSPVPSARSWGGQNGIVHKFGREAGFGCVRVVGRFRSHNGAGAIGVSSMPLRSSPHDADICPKSGVARGPVLSHACSVVIAELALEVRREPICPAPDLEPLQRKLVLSVDPLRYIAQSAIPNESRATSWNTGRSLPTSGHIRSRPPKFDRSRVDFGRSEAETGRSRPSSGHVCPNWDKV